MAGFVVPGTNGSEDRDGGGFGGPLLAEGAPEGVDLVLGGPGILGGVELGGDGDLVAEQELERVGQLAVDVARVVDPDLLEDGLVHLAAHGRSGGEVGAAPVRGEVDDLVEVRLDGVEGDVDGSEPFFGGGDGLADAVLFALEEVERDGVGVVGVEELA